MSAPDPHALLDFIAMEARLVDAARYEEWLALFAESGRYWLPLKAAAQEEGEAHNARPTKTACCSHCASSASETRARIRNTRRAAASMCCSSRPCSALTLRRGGSS